MSDEKNEAEVTATNPPESGDAPVVEEAAPNAPAAAEGFVVADDDPPAMEPAIEWTSRELIKGMSFEAATTQLIANGWPADAAEHIVEEARQRTRHERGVVTREDVARGVAQRYRKTMANTRWGAFGGLPILLAAVRNRIRTFKAMFAETKEKPELKEPRTK
jgi:hypothetical protein